MFLVYAAEPVDQALHGPQYGIRESFLAAEDTSHEDPQRLGDKENRKEIEANLEQPLAVMTRISPVSAEQQR